MVLWWYNNAALLPFKISAQTVRKMHVYASKVVLDAEAREPLPSDTNFTAVMRAAGDRDRAASGIREILLDDPHAEGG